MPLSKVLLITIILVLPSFSGCMFLRQTTFTLISLTVDDDEGFPRLYIAFNASDLCFLTLTNPNKTLLFSETYYQGIYNESLYLSGYRETVAPGTYMLKATDASKNTIYQQDLQFTGENLQLISLSVDQWDGNMGSCMVGLHLTVRNSGDLPAYPSKVTITHGATSGEAFLPPTVILPYNTQQIPCFLFLSPPPPLESKLNISLYGNTDSILLESPATVIKKTPVDSWQYRWHHLGECILQVPEVDWLFDYYKRMDRFDTLDYAAYVFDRIDESYLAFLVNQLLSLRDLRTNTEKINFIASFIQSIEYKNDDPENESYEYPRYPLETLKERRGDCEDKAILTAALLGSVGYNVSLLRLPHHMAVGVYLNETIPLYSYYINQYYFLETTTLQMTLGRIPPEYQGLTNVTVYSISSRPLLIHQWKSATRFQISTGEDYVQVKIILENLGIKDATNIEVRGALYDNASWMYNQQSKVVLLLVAGGKQLVELSINVPVSVSTALKTQLYDDGVMVNQRESTAQFS